MKLRYALSLLSLPAARPHRGGRPPRARRRSTTPTNRVWLCRPARADACAVDLTTTVVTADGSARTEAFDNDPSAAIDCFYVYPTVSTDQAENSDMTPDEAELRVIEQQFARFRSVCSTYAPFYRQITLRGLSDNMGSARSGDRLRGRARRVSALPRERQRRAGLRARRPLPGLVHPHQAGGRGDRRAALAGQACLRSAHRCSPPRGGGP